MELQAWRAVAASVTGASHLKTGTPCQDSHRLEVITHDRPVVILIAADGAGSASRSEQGSTCACQALHECVRLYLEAGGRVADVSRALAAQWLERAARALEHTAEQQGVALREFACTLLAAVVEDDHALFLQIGDGAIVFRVRGEDDWCIASWPQHGEYINSTRFLTEPESRVSVEFVSTAMPVDEVAVFTDGLESLVLHYATQTVHRPFFDAMFPTVRASEVAGFNADLSHQLSGYLASPALSERSDDDITLMLATRAKLRFDEQAPIVDL